jgi:hypothetical protein
MPVANITGTSSHCRLSLAIALQVVARVELCWWGFWEKLQGSRLRVLTLSGCIPAGLQEDGVVPEDNGLATACPMLLKLTKLLSFSLHV